MFQCSVKSKPKTKKPFFARASDYVAHLFERDSQEFIGWHGTNSVSGSWSTVHSVVLMPRRLIQDTAAFWTQKGQLEKPVKADGFFDFIGLGPKSSSGTSGADAEIGPGVYVTDDQDMCGFSLLKLILRIRVDSLLAFCTVP